MTRQKIRVVTGCLWLAHIPLFAGLSLGFPGGRPILAPTGTTAMEFWLSGAVTLCALLTAYFSVSLRRTAPLARLASAAAWSHVSVVIYFLFRSPGTLALVPILALVTLLVLTQKDEA